MHVDSLGKRVRSGWLVLIVALALGVGSYGAVSAQDSNGSVTLNQGNGNESGEGNSEGGPQNQSQSQQTSQGIESGPDEFDTAVNVYGQEQSQSRDMDRSNENTTSQANTASVSDLAGDDASSDDDTTEVTGDENGATPLLEEDDLVGGGDFIGVLIAILLSILSTPVPS